MPQSHGRVVALLCAAEALSMVGFSTFPALLATLRDAWALSGKAAGAIAGAYFAGYMLAVPLLTSLTDRRDARHIYAAACLLSAAGLLGFALWAQGTWSAALFQALAGAGLAGTYMPGLKLLTDRVVSPRQGRYVAFYTSTFGLGTSLSLLLAGALEAGGWRIAFVAAALGPLAAGAMVLFRLGPAALPAAPLQRASDEARPVWRDRAVLGYAAHCWELFGLRAWMVAFIGFAYALDPAAGNLALAPAAAAALINLLGSPASILGNEIATRVGRRGFITAAMLASAALAWITGFSAPLLGWATVFLLGLYFVCVMADSAALTAGLVAVAPAAQRGAALALYSFLGFGAGFVAPLAFGAIIDAAGGKADATAWGLALASLGAGCALAPLLLGRTARSR